MNRDRKPGHLRASLKCHFAPVFVIGCILQFLISPLAIAADRIAYQDFESSGWESQFTGQNQWGDNITRTTSNPFTGSHSLRWNQHVDRTDPITGLDGIGNSLLDWRGGTNIVSQTPNEMFFRMSFRHDDYYNDAPYQDAARKLFYLVDQNFNVGAMFLSRQLGLEVPYISYTNGAYSEAWANENWGYKCMYLQNPNVSPGLNGDWRVCEMYFNYDEHYVMLWFDGHLMLPKTTGSNAIYWDRFPEDAAAGRIRYDPNLTLHFKGVQIGYFARTYDCVNCRDGSEYYCGFQIDELEVWNGMPDGPVASGPGLSGQPIRISGP